VDLLLELVADGTAREESGEALVCSVMATHKPIDVEDRRALSATVVTDDDLDAARRIGQELMWKAWKERYRVTADPGRLLGQSLPEAVEKALAQPPGTVVLADWGDAVSMGLPGDNADFLAYLLEHSVGVPACMMVHDPDLVRRSMEAGIGNQVAGPIGGRWGGDYYQPVPVSGRVRSLFDGQVWPKAATSNNTLGLTAVVQVADNITVVATSLPSVQTDPKVFRVAGVEPSDYRLVLVKAVYQHSRLFAPIATEFVFISEGRADLHALPWEKQDPMSTYPFRDFSDDEIRAILGWGS
jgi:microcystin degradation protein MlrC